MCSLLMLRDDLIQNYLAQESNAMQFPHVLDRALIDPLVFSCFQLMLNYGQLCFFFFRGHLFLIWFLWIETKSLIDGVYFIHI